MDNRKTVILSAIALVAIAGIAVLVFFVTQKPEESSLVAHWKFDQSEGNTITDASKKGNQGELHGSTWTEGKLGQAMKFDGTDDYVEAPNSDGLNFEDEMTIAAWVNLAEVGKGRQILVQKNPLEKSDDFTNYTLYAQWDGDKLAFIVGNGKRRVGVLSEKGIGKSNEWRHLAVTMKKDEVGFYIDGEPAGTDSITIKPYTNDGPLLIGRYTSPDGTSKFHLNGKLDELRIYNKALSQKEITDLYQQD